MLRKKDQMNELIVTQADEQDDGAWCKNVDERLYRIEKTLAARISSPGIENGEERMQILERRSDPKMEDIDYR